MTAIIKLTWKEMLRKRVMLLTFIMTVIFLIAYWFVSKTMSAGLDNLHLDKTSFQYLLQAYQVGSITLTLGFFFGSFVIAFLSIFSSFSVIAGEAEQAVLQAILPRPFPRWRWYVGRWVGYVSLGIAYAFVLFVSILVISDVHAAIPHDFSAWVKSFLLFMFVVPMLVSLSMLGSSIFSALGNGVFMTMMFGGGWLGGMIEKVGAFIHLQEATMKPLSTIGGLLSLSMPADAIQRRMLAELFSIADFQSITNISAQLGPLGFYPIPSNIFLIYAVCYTLLAGFIGLRLFCRKDI